MYHQNTELPDQNISYHVPNYNSQPKKRSEITLQHCKTKAADRPPGREPRDCWGCACIDTILSTRNFNKLNSFFIVYLHPGYIQFKYYS